MSRLSAKVLNKFYSKLQLVSSRDLKSLQAKTTGRKQILQASPLHESSRASRSGVNRRGRPSQPSCVNCVQGDTVPAPQLSSCCYGNTASLQSVTEAVNGAADEEASKEFRDVLGKTTTKSFPEKMAKDWRMKSLLQSNVQTAMHYDSSLRSRCPCLLRE